MWLSTNVTTTNRKDIKKARVNIDCLYGRKTEKQGCTEEGRLNGTVMWYGRIEGVKLAKGYGVVLFFISLL